MATFENPNQLSLGRVSTAAPVLRSTAPMPHDYNADLVNSLVGIGKTISGALVQEQRRKEFYEGQDRILQASLEGTQKEELKKVLDEQPWYMQVMGPGAVAEGAIQMASKVGAGRMFDEYSARLATGQDDSVHPDEYRNQIMDVIRGNLTGDATVDSVFMPQLIAKGQDLIGSQVKRNLEHNVKSAQVASVQESNDAIAGFRGIMNGQPFVAGVAPENMPEEQKLAYSRLKDSFSPETRPPMLSEDGWKMTKLAIAEAAISDGDTAVYQAVQESGLYSKLSGEERVRLDAAKEKGAKEVSKHMQMGMLDQELKLHEKVLTAKTDQDVQDTLTLAQGIYQQYKAAGIEPPANLKDDAAIKQYVFGALGNKIQYLESESKRLARVRQISDKAAAEASESEKLGTAIINNALADNPTADVYLTTQDGNAGYVQVTKDDRENAYARVKNMLMGRTPDERAAWLKKNNLGNVESLAYKLQIVDTARQGELTQLLRMTSGISSHNHKNGEAVVDRIGRAMGIIDSLGKDIPRAGIGEYIADEDLRKDLDVYMNHVELTGDLMGAWDASFGRDRSVKVEYDKQKFEKVLDKGSVNDVIKQSGMDAGVVRQFIRDEAVDNLRSRRATTEDDAVKQALVTLDKTTERIGDVRVFGVPDQYRVMSKLGIRNPQTASTLTDTYVRSTLPPGWGYHIDFDPRTQRHYVIPQNSDGTYLPNQIRPLDYKAVKALLADPKALKSAAEKVKPVQGDLGNHDDYNVYGL